ncbi:phosphatidylinositol 4,5-bisphosphate 5-phosphatase A isoform X2 [Aethina tumida]|uniref:phosphatidylinositol 4,5-bisphosphate 5-phosphatase A isoform X2 n=1 Tax=Aethina tumida TaxID=116153 RepID=UPI00096B13D9|nr:phosphatidylinositol 4,5-bisphosphate 5-phosphatase A isoform X2 [Aethina tumida]
MDNLRIYVATYNVGTENPKDTSLHDLLSFKDDRKMDKIPDIYVLAFQEVNAQPHNMLRDSLFDDAWTKALKDLLQIKDYVKIKSIRLQGILLILFSLRKHILNIREVESEYTRTGLSGMWGNKGAVSIRLNISGCSLCFVNSHLSAHDGELDSRIDDYNKIIKDQDFHIPETSKILFHDYVFWMGDLNFRLMEEYDQMPEEIDRTIKKKELKKLFEHDQLRHVMKEQKAFSELTEKEPDFPPTFKYEVGTHRYDYKRRPAWCDRILYRVNAKNYENITLNVDQLSYKSHPSYCLSDHKPVSAEFLIKVFSDYIESTVEFEEITSWNEEDENKAAYKVSGHLRTDVQDWIGIFKENFTALDEYVAYEYVSKCSTPTGEAQPATFSPRQPQRFEVTFSELPNQCKGKYCLIYFRQSEDQVSSVLGISNAFPIVKNHSD